jgi:hypothetical protein
VTCTCRPLVRPAYVRGPQLEAMPLGEQIAIAAADLRRRRANGSVVVTATVISRNDEAHRRELTSAN